MNQFFQFARFTIHADDIRSRIVQLVRSWRKQRDRLFLGEARPCGERIADCGKTKAATSLLGAYTISYRLLDFAPSGISFLIKALIFTFRRKIKPGTKLGFAVAFLLWSWTASDFYVDRAWPAGLRNSLVLTCP
jgi:hypothetical protein